MPTYRIFLPYKVVGSFLTSPFSCPTSPQPSENAPPLLPFLGRAIIPT